MVIDEVFINNQTHYVFLRNNPNLYKIDVASKDLVLVENNALPNIHLNTINDELENNLILL